MGIRVVVILQGDLAHLWANDEDLGAKILAQAQYMCDTTDPCVGPAIEGAEVVACTDDLLQSLVIINGYQWAELAHGVRRHGEPGIQILIKLLSEAASSIGYSLYKTFMRFRYWH